MKKIQIISYLINPININFLLRTIIQWHKRKKFNYICISNVHSCVLSFWDKKFKKAHNSAGLALADGRPIYWALRLLGLKNAKHLPGYYVTEKICELAHKKKLNIGFYGSTNYNLNRIKINLKKNIRGLISIIFIHHHLEN